MLVLESMGYYSLVGIQPERLAFDYELKEHTSRTQQPICTHLCAFMKVFAAVPAHTRWLWPLCQGQYEVKSTCKFIFIFPHYLPGYQSEAIKVVAGGFQPGMISTLANQTLYRMATAYFEAKMKANSPYELFSTISQYILIAYANFPCTWSHLTLNKWFSVTA